ncbi:BnaA06g12200D [Brassica napus]|uniref:BnaA06g12200D protein n=1 Tax=Brassica napus TaxID=3708 RepID=A0A078GLY0_BRANA|nr:BnaA06g12200D [Brassica napus]
MLIPIQSYFILFLSLIFNTLASPRLEMNALLEFKNEFPLSAPDPHASFAFSFSSWNTSSDHCSWKGVTCNANSGEVISLFLQFIFLNGSLKANSSLLKLQHLDSLTLSHCNLIGKIPSSLGNLSHLIDLDLYGNNLVGEVPPTIGNLNQLTFMVLASNNLSEFGNTSSSSKLEWLNLASNNFNGPIPESISGFLKLGVLDLSNNSFLGPIPGSMSQLVSLRVLDLSYNKLEGQVPNVSRNQLSGKLPKSLINCKSMEYLNLKGNKFKDTFQVIFLVILPNSPSYHTWTSPTTFSKVQFHEALSFKDNIIFFTSHKHIWLVEKFKLFHLTSRIWISSEILGDDNALLSPLPVCDEGEKGTRISYQNTFNLEAAKTTETTNQVSTLLGENYEVFYLVLTENIIFSILAKRHNFFRCGHFGIYDGHGGRLAAEFAKKHLHLNVLSSGLPRELVCFTLFRFINNVLFFCAKLDCFGVTHSVGLTWHSFSSFSCFAKKAILDERKHNFIEVENKIIYVELIVNKSKAENVIPFHHFIIIVAYLLDILQVTLKCWPFLWFRNHLHQLRTIRCESNLILSMMIPSQSFFIFFLSIIFNTLASPTLQRDALLEFKNEFPISEPDDPLQKSLSSWNTSSSDHCSWEGVTCNANSGEVISFSLQFIFLNGGEIPSSLGNLSNLKHLEISSNQDLAGEIPSSLGNFSHLMYLDLSANDLVGEIPSSLGNLNQLTFMRFSTNNLTGHIPSSFANFNKLSNLDLSRNQFSGGDLPLILSNLTSLSELDLSNNHFKSKLPSNMSRLHNLKVFDVKRNYFLGNVPTSLFMIPMLLGFYWANPWIYIQINFPQ